MPAYTAPALLIGLGARLALNLLTRNDEQTVRDFIMMGVWQGVALQYAYNTTVLAIPLFCGMAAKLVIDFAHSQDPNRCAVTIIGVVLGYTCTDFLSQFIDPPAKRERRRRHSQAVLKNANLHTTSPLVQRQRLVQFRRSQLGDTTQTDTPDHDPHPNAQQHPNQSIDITSVDSNSDLVGSKYRTQLERDIATLRAQALLADTERRRCKEERKWAIAQGNTAMADQLKWEVKRFASLVQKYTKDAEAKELIGASRALSLPPEQTQPQPIAGPSTSRRQSRERDRRHARDDNSVYYSVAPTETRSQRTRSGTLKSAMRDRDHR
ncbi:hypothetical protein AX16_005246 [Volvariella volvacea WC 439]|nr:hypothetical protein AX16_005246 [Volvariella volvacea WC 439]